ncbi:MAG: C39 family peptidase, partial [Selenomonadaceae bacterium]|nr:C39 family peptidase [Selenomonadaceae bacterium]
DSIYFTHPDFANMTSNADRIILSNYPTYQQTTEYSCAPAAALSVLNYFGNHDFDEATLIKRMNTDSHIGTSLGNMVKFFREIGWDVQSGLDTPPIDEVAFRQSVAKNLSEGKPIMVENIEFGGHWRVIIGIDTLGTEELYDDVLIFADPYDTSDHNQDGYAIESLDRFFYMWFDHNMLPENERNQPWLIATPKH